MRNSVKIFRKQKGLSQAGLGELTGKAFQTISQYENSDEPLPPEFLASAAEALGVSVEQLAAEPPGEWREDAPEYRAQAIPLGALDTPLLEQVLKALNATWMNAPEPRRGLALGAMVTIHQELKQRGAAGAETPAVSSRPPSATRAVLGAAAAGVPEPPIAPPKAKR